MRRPEVRPAGPAVSQAVELRRRYVEELRREGVTHREDVLRAFDAVPREEFVRDGFTTGDGRLVAPTDADFLDLVYRDAPLVTKLVDGVPVSSSSQPSLMAAMIEALDLRPGSRVLEIGVGTGYNAALMSAVGARVTSVDIQPDVVDRAVAALARIGLAGAVDVRLGDGYLGVPDAGPYDRVVVTVGLTGVSPHWLAQLVPDGCVLAPVAHAGSHPVLRVWRSRTGAVEGRAVLRAGFMSAAGPLAARHPWSHVAPRGGPLAPTTLRHPPVWRPPLDVFGYHDLWFAVGAWDRRAGFGAGPAGGWGGPGGCVLLDGAGTSWAGILADGSVQAAGPSAGGYAADALALRDRWVDEGRPRIDEWCVPLVATVDPETPILVPSGWQRRR
ncbi:protein-L-isoaspartate O-methyltransferase family protein [Plantactinospora sonchi]|uniref:Protein-L-isoaspartate O-methyltransferase n=1 Tax=Plantactinospora sonchi TaxID=1544735 RepID=A0ABU7S041_9ACTN